MSPTPDQCDNSGFIASWTHLSANYVEMVGYEIVYEERPATI